MAAAITYIRSSITKSQTSPIVLMGFSTGCQDLMHYLVSPVNASIPRPSISGIILQAPVSDREAMLHTVSTKPAAKEAYEKALSLASETPKDKHRTTILPIDVIAPFFAPIALTVSRFLSLASPDSPENPGMDDYYSSDLFDDRLASTFGRIGTVSHFILTKTIRSVLILQGGRDRSIPAHIDKAAMLARWTRFLMKGGAEIDPNSQIIEHADHGHFGTDLEAREAKMVTLRGAVLHYLDAMVGGVGDVAHGVWERDRDALKEEAFAKRLEEKARIGDDAKL